MNSLCRSIAQKACPRKRLVVLQSYYYFTKSKSTDTSSATTAAAAADDDSPPLRPSGWTAFPVNGEPKSERNSALDWARPREIPFQAKVANSVNLIGYVHAPVHFETTADGCSWAATVITQRPISSDDSFDSLPLWVPIIFEGDLAHIAASHLKENDHVYIVGQLSSGLPHVNSNQLQASIQVMVRNLNFVEESVQTKKHITLCKQVKGTYNNFEHVNKDGDSVLHSWRDLTDNPKEWWDYRDIKINGLVSPKFPDFKRKDGSNPLWLNRAPQWVLKELKGLEFDVQIQKSKELKHVKDSMPNDGNGELNFWRDLIDNPKQWRDYRNSKLNGLVNPKHPDFKHKDGSHSLWLDSAPLWVSSKLEGLEFDIQIQKSKEVKGNKVELWKDLVENPNKWWDNRLDKIKERAPDFKHKETGEGLWLNDAPTWVESKLPPPKSNPNVAMKKRDTLLS